MRHDRLTRGPARKELIFEVFNFFVIPATKVSSKHAKGVLEPPTQTLAISVAAREASFEQKVLRSS